MSLELEETATAGLDDTATHAPGPSAPRVELGVGLGVGQRVGHFRIERHLGAGGMGEVYLATDLSLDRPVAIKVLPDAMARDVARRERLTREARAQARVAHPNVGHIYYVGEDGGHLFVAMEYVAGETLAQRIASEPMSLDAALAAVRGAALGLREAHRAGFLHRDVKPSNLMLDQHGELKVLDFGLAAGAASANGETVVSVTQTSLAGTPLYMAPEQARGEAIDVRADIYALGATLYHLVSGRPPFEATTADELRTLHASAPRPRVPDAKQPRTAPALGELCARMMATRPSDRFASYDELLAALDALAAARSRPGGFFVRVIAMTFDFLVVGIAVALLLALFGFVSGYEPARDGAFEIGALGLYQTICVARWGRTLGKLIFDLEVVGAVSGARPSWGQATRRAIALMGLPFALEIAGLVAAWREAESAVPREVSLAAYFVLVIALGYASIRSYGRRAFWDRWSDTLVRYRVAPRV